MEDLDELFITIKKLTNKRFFGRVSLVFEAGNLVHSEITQKLKPHSILITEKFSVLKEST